MASQVDPTKLSGGSTDGIELRYVGVEISHDSIGAGWVTAQLCKGRVTHVVGAVVCDGHSPATCPAIEDDDQTWSTNAHVHTDQECSASVG